MPTSRRRFLAQCLAGIAATGSVARAQDGKSYFFKIAPASIKVSEGYAVTLLISVYDGRESLFRIRYRSTNSVITIPPAQEGGVTYPRRIGTWTISLTGEKAGQPTVSTNAPIDFAGSGRLILKAGEHIVCGINVTSSYTTSGRREAATVAISAI